MVASAPNPALRALRRHALAAVTIGQQWYAAGGTPAARTVSQAHASYCRNSVYHKALGFLERFDSRCQLLNRVDEHKS